MRSPSSARRLDRFRGALADEPALATLEGGSRTPPTRCPRRRLDARARSRQAAAPQGAGVSAVPVWDPDDLRADPHLAARGAIVTVEHGDVGPERHAGNPIRMSRTPITTAGPSPLLGAHTDAVLERWLGLGAAEVQRLRDAGVCR
jgi:crotonobetainyl-CoA:carnitine CoA-transferase CaiB-like acyl-CoA transferase